MSWIKTIGYQEADASLKKIYDRVKGPNYDIDNVLLVHSLRPHTLHGHMMLYKNVLHHSGNTLPKWYLEYLGVYVSFLNHCDYCVEHHYAGLKRLLNDDLKAEKFNKAIINDCLQNVLSQTQLAGCKYARKLTLSAPEVTEKDIDDLRKQGMSDGQILEVNQVVSYFNYVNRTVLGLGVNIKDDVLGLSPSDNADSTNWSHL